MGIRGLTTYVAKHSDRYLEPYELKSCTIIVDGNNIACQLYKWVSKCNCAFGGDYDKYSECVKRFFTLLKKCEVIPLVLFDGGYEHKKLSTVYSRLKRKLYSAKAINPVTQSKHNLFPLFMKETFLDVLKTMDISFVQCDFEADGEIASIARQLGCPVLSYDSDFYVFDVLYIPFSSMILEPVKYETSDKCIKYYINCQIYRIETFLNSLGGLDKALLPVLAVLLGNDYIEKSVLKNFLSQIKQPKGRSMSSTQRQIVGILHWLRNESLDTAVMKILSRLKKTKREEVLKQLEEIISGYKSCSSDLLPLLCTKGNNLQAAVETTTIQNTLNLLSVKNMVIANHDCEVLEEKEECVEERKKEDKEDEQIEENVKDKERRNEGDGDGDDDDNCEEEEEEEINDDKNKDNNYPNANENQSLINLAPTWFQNSFHRGNLPAIFINMLVLRTHFCTPQVENFSISFSHKISLPIVKVIFGLLTTKFKDSDLILNYVAYEKSARIHKIDILPVYETPSVSDFPLLQNVPDVPLDIRKNILYDVIKLNSSEITIVNSFPDDWKIIILSLVYWVRNAYEPAVTNYHVHALLFSMITLNVVDSHIGYIRTKKVFLKKNGKRLNDSSEIINKKISECKSYNMKEIVSHQTVAQCLKEVLDDDCLYVFEKIIPYHTIDECLKTRPKLFSLNSIHAFAQFQSCLYFINHLNALLNFPFPWCQIAKFYSGTLVYNAYTNFKKHSDVENYVVTYILNFPTLAILYRIMVKTVSHFFPDLMAIGPKARNQRKKKRKSKTNEMQTGDENNARDESETEVEELLKNNRFCALSLAGKC